jgi:hypothetical protein
MKKNETKNSDAATAQTMPKADRENARLHKQREASPDGITKAKRAATQSAKDAPKTPTSATPAKKSAKATAKAKPKRAATGAKQGRQKAKQQSGLDAAAKVLAESKQPMTCRQIVEAAFDKKYWTSTGRTPHATIYSALIREIATKGKDSRFRKVGPGRFAIRG